ncbi:MAG: flavodoxin family protein [Actinobacteria bacterium]|nr:flavodoxin family protein [Actinomycetota bacterium]
MDHPMNALVVYCHPVEGSFCSAMRDAAVRGLQAAGHTVDVIDLAASQFNPVMSRSEWQNYQQGSGQIPDGLQHDVELIKTAEIIVFVYPTWWGGLPAQLKGWLERVMLPGTAFVFNDNNKVRPGLGNIKHMHIASTFGSPWLYVRFVNDNGRRILARAFRLNTSLRTKVSTSSLYAMDTATDASRDNFLDALTKKMERI